MTDQPQGQKPALTVIVQSWWTPALAVIMLVVGLLVGYLGRPLFNKDAQTPGAVAAVTTPAVNPTIAAIDSSEKFMAYIVSQTKHFEGDPNAKVTLIEFSDYQ